LRLEFADIFGTFKVWKTMDAKPGWMDMLKRTE
jgi:hypothetical protein